MAAPAATGGAAPHQAERKLVTVLPRTHDDDPERAVRAALAIRQAVGLARAGARTRVAVATGRALVRLGARGAAGQRVLGDPITTCARLLEVAPPGAILVAESTVRASERAVRSEEHTSELQSRRDLVCRLLL